MCGTIGSYVGLGPKKALPVLGVNCSDYRHSMGLIRALQRY